MSAAKDRFFAIVNPAAGGGKSAKLAGATLARLRDNRIHVDVIASSAPGHAGELAHEAYQQGYRSFLAVGGDGTAHEIINGIFSRHANPQRLSLGFLPLGTGNSFLRDFTRQGADDSVQAILANRKRPMDLVRLTHATGEVYSFNILSVGFTADVGALTNRVFKPLGHLGFLRMLPRLYDGTHIEHRLASRKSVRHVEFNIPLPVDVLVDGEIFTLKCQELDIVPSALDVY